MGPLLLFILFLTLGLAVSPWFFIGCLVIAVANL